MEYVNNMVSVIMSNFNTPEEFLRSSIESVLNQTYKNFEFIIIDDCSTDNSLDIIRSYDDKRIRILKNEKNLGITKSLNRGLAIAQGEFVARMDADDICLPQRFEKQVEFLKNNPQVIVCGAGVELIGNWQGKYSHQRLCREIPDKETFRIQLLFGNYPNIVHPTAMFDRKKLDLYKIKYNEDYIYAQDYRMWVSCSEHGECENIPETLLYYRVHGGAVSGSKKEQQDACALGIMKEQLLKLGLDLTEEYEEIHRNFLLERKEYSLKCKKWIKIILNQNKKQGVYDHKRLKKILWGKWTEISYFGLRKQKNPFGMLRVAVNIPLNQVGSFLQIKKQRSNKNKEN